MTQRYIIKFSAQGASLFLKPFPCLHIQDENQATKLRKFLESASSNVPQEPVQRGAFRSFQTVGTELQSLYDQAVLAATNGENAAATIKKEVALLEQRKRMLMEEVEAYDKKGKMLKMAHVGGFFFGPLGK